MGYKISVVEKQLKELNEQIEKETERRFNLRQRNERLNEQKEMNFNKALNDYRQYNNSLRSEKVCDKDEVIKEMKQLWQIKQKNEQEISRIRDEMKRTDKETTECKKELNYWKDFRDDGASKLDLQIKLLKQEKIFMTENFQVISNSLRINLEKTLEGIVKNTEDTIQRKNRSAAEKALKDMDKNAVEMAHDNEWMQRKIDLYRKEYEELKANTSILEKENIQLMSYLFECGTEDLKCIKDAFQVQFLDDENLEENNIMTVDLDELESVRPGSGLDMAIRKLKELELKNRDKSEMLAISDRPYEEQNNYLSLGPYDFKTLSLDGYRKPLIKLATPTLEELKANNFKGDEWPITHEMLYDALKQ